MAIIYLRSSDGSDSDDGSTWALAKATLAGALTAAAAGDTIYVSHQHAESAGAVATLTSPGTAASPVQIICVNDGAEPPTARATTATVTTTGTNSIAFQGFAYCYGVAFKVGSGNSSNPSASFSSTNPWWWRLERCALEVLSTGTTNSGSRIVVGPSSTSTTDGGLELVDSTVRFGHVNHGFAIRAPLLWTGSLSAVNAAGTIPTNLIQPAGSGFGQSAIVDVIGVDLSSVGSGKNLVGSGATNWGRVRFVNCKLGASVAIAGAATAGQGGVVVEAINCDSADTNYRYHRQDYAGTITQETTIVRTGGASDGTTPISYKFVTTANSKWYYPLRGPWATLWNETTGSGVTLTAEVVTDNVTLTDAEAWIEVEHLGTSGFPLSLIESDQITDPIFGTPANQTSSSVTWTTTGLGTPVKQKLSKQVTPQEKGPIRARVVLAKPSTTMYADFKLLA